MHKSVPNIDKVEVNTDSPAKEKVMEDRIKPDADILMQAVTSPTAKSDTDDKVFVDFAKVLFWLCLLICVPAASMALAWREAVGRVGPIFLIFMATGAMVFLIWIMSGAGRRLGIFPHRGSAEAALNTGRKPYAWIDALDEPALIVESGGAAVTANAAYNQLSSLARGISQSDRPVTVDRVFGAVPGLAAPIYRLAKASKAGHVAKEVLPAIAIGQNDQLIQYEASVAPISTNRMLWRLRRLDQLDPSYPIADSHTLYIQDAPVGCIVFGTDSKIRYMNIWACKFLELSDDISDPATIRLDDILAIDSLGKIRRNQDQDKPREQIMKFHTRYGSIRMAKTLIQWTNNKKDIAGQIFITSVIEPKGLIAGVDMTEVPPQSIDESDIFGDAPFGIATLNGENLQEAKIVSLNHALLDMSEGKARAGSTFIDLFDLKDGGAVLEHIDEASDKMVELRLKGDEIKTVNVFAAFNEMGQPSAAFIIDVSEHKQLEMRLAQGEKMQAIGQLAGGVAHDFNNMLTGVMLNCDKLLARHPVGDPSFHELKSINELSARAAELVRMLLAYARKQTFKREMLDISDVLSEFSVLLRQLLDERIELDLKHGRNLPKISCDKGQLETAIINLATNARDAMLSKNESGGGVLTIRTSKASGSDAHDEGFHFVGAGEYLCIEVADTGSGMKPEILEQIFQPFFTTKAQGEGTGLGLATVYGIVKQSEGYICPRSVEGNGTSFKIYLPAMSSEAVAEAQEVANNEEVKSDKPADLAGRGRIMLVEDEDSVRGIAAQLLQSCGYQVMEAGDGEEALDIIKEQAGEFDLLISDVVLPGIDGPALLQEAKPYLGNARIMFISGYAERDLAKTLDEERSISFLPKPFTLRQLAERVKTELAA